MYFVNNVVPNAIKVSLRNLGAKVLEMDEIGDRHASLWRFTAATKGYDAVIFRDTDSRMSLREGHAVHEWMNSDKLVHVMRDHRWHTFPVMAGMWGLKKGSLLNGIAAKVEGYINDLKLKK